MSPMEIAQAVVDGEPLITSSVDNLQLLAWRRWSLERSARLDAEAAEHTARLERWAERVAAGEPSETAIWEAVSLLLAGSKLATARAAHARRCVERLTDLAVCQGLLLSGVRERVGTLEADAPDPRSLLAPRPN